jgi:general secretion pathway protein L
MRALSVITAGFSQWIDSVAATVIALHGRLAPPRVIKLIEGEAGKFAFQIDEQTADSKLTNGHFRIVEGKIVEALPDSMAQLLSGRRIELVLRSERFLFAPLALPSRAAEFLEGVVRAQIDRLTPWAAPEAVFGWSKPTETGAERIAVTIAATARSLILPYVQAIASLGAHSIAVITSPDNTNLNCIQLWEARAAGVTKNAHRLRQAVVALLVIAATTATLAVSTSMIIRPILEARKEALLRQKGDIHSILGGSRNVTAVAAAAFGFLERRKNDRPPNVIVLEELSQILPDQTYVTELNIEKDRLRISGITQDAPSLVGAFEQSGQFTQATFFAPTTRSPSDPGEHFNIEAHIQSSKRPHS